MRKYKEFIIKYWNFEIIKFFLNLLRNIKKL